MYKRKVLSSVVDSSVVVSSVVLSSVVDSTSVDSSDPDEVVSSVEPEVDVSSPVDELVVSVSCCVLVELLSDPPDVDALFPELLVPAPELVVSGELVLVLVVSGAVVVG